MQQQQRHSNWHRMPQQQPRPLMGVGFQPRGAPPVHSPSPPAANRAGLESPPGFRPRNKDQQQKRKAVDNINEENNEGKRKKSPGPPPRAPRLHRLGHPPDRRPGDWDCANCTNVNFAHRNRCHFCKVGKKQQQSGEFAASKSKSDHESNKQEGDWECQDCGKNNFKFRKECFGCKKPKSEQQRQSLPQRSLSRSRSPSMTSQAHSSPSSSQHSIPSSHMQPSHPQSSSSLHQSTSLPMSHQRVNESPFSSLQHQSVNEASSSEEYRNLVEQEKQFDVMFEAWNKNFDQWVMDHRDNPDREFVQNQIEQMTQMRKNMLLKRENLRKKRSAVMDREVSLLN